MVALGMVVALVVLWGAIVAATGVFITVRNLQGAVDRAALAASDVSRGINGEYPCAVATHILHHHGFDLASCELDRGNARVVGTVDVAGLSLTRRAHAGVGNSGQP